MAKKTREEKNLEIAQQRMEQAQAELELAERRGAQRNRPQLKKDPRVNVEPISWSFFLFVFLGVLIINSCQIMVYGAMAQSGLSWVTMAPSLVGFACLMSLIVCCIIVGVRNVSFNRPVRYLGDAARQIAAGDFSVRVAPMRKDGKKDYMEILIDDFNTMTEELSGIDAMKDNFIGNVSHEIKTPVAVIQNYASALQDINLTEDKRQEYTTTIVDASKRLSYLITNILMLNKLESQKIVASASHFDLSEQLCQCVFEFEDQWETKKIEFSADLEDTAPVEFDKDMLEIVWKNLLSNAIKFSDVEGKVSLTQRNSDGATLVSVTDTGCGMDEDTVRHIFEKFYQGDTSHAEEGNGLGLALVKRIVDLCGGDITVDSAPGAGTTISVRLKTADAKK